MRQRRIGLFVTCLVDLMRPSVGIAALRLLEATGAQVVAPATQTCCGQPVYNAGDERAARALARKLLQEFRDCEYVVVPSGSCAAMVRVHYPRLFAGDPLLAEIEALARRTYELTDFLTSVAKVGRVSGRFSGAITYHDACSGLRELGIARQPRVLLAQVEGLRLTEMQEARACCGFGGTFAVKFTDISARMADNKCADIVQTGADAVVAGDLGCLLHLEGRLRRQGDEKTRVLHIAEVLAGEEA